MSKKKNNSGCGCGCLIIFILFIIIYIFIINIAKTDKTPSNDYVDPSIDYINDTRDLAVKTANKYNLFASVIMAQSALESNWGTSGLATEYNNYFGIKSNDNTNSVLLKTQEYQNNNMQNTAQAFRIYKNKKESFEHYAKLITLSERYKPVVNAKNYEEAAHALKNCKYATDPNYDKKIIMLIEKYNFQELDIKKD